MLAVEDKLFESALLFNSLYFRCFDVSPQMFGPISFIFLELLNDDDY